MMRKLGLFWLAPLFFAAMASSTIHPSAPPETKQFSSMLGIWQIQDFQKQHDGSWQQGLGATWEWHTILDGYAIQDNWIAPVASQEGKVIRYRHGTNIRVYNPKKQQWEMAWISSTGLQVDTFTAKKVDNAIVMRGIFSGSDSKITFFDMEATSFKWKLELLAGGQWQEVYRIKGTK
ncbi:MAG: hypothetical protein ACFHVJ_03460 [Aestuariibacter sp.]